MDSKAIKAILEKYWEGESSLEEENTLRSYFQQEDIPEELKVFQPMFRYFKEEQEAYLNGDFDERLSSKLKAADNQKPRRSSLIITLRRAAAIAAILIGVLFFVKEIDVIPGGGVDPETEEAKMAYAEAKAALLLISKKLNKGTSKAQSGVVKVRKATKVIRE